MSTFTVGEQVNVESRTWPGINKPGGVGKIVKIHSEGPGIVVAVDVRYILGGTEKEVELQYVTKHEELNRGGRSRSRREVMNLGPEESSSSEKPTRRSSAAAATPKKPAANANAGSAKKKKKAAAKKSVASTDASSSKRKPLKKEDATTKKRKTDTSTAKGKKSSASTAASGGKKGATLPPVSAVSQSDSDSIVVSADESEFSASQKPAAAAKKQKKVAIAASSKSDSRSMPPPPPVTAAAAFASAKPASKPTVQPRHPKLKNVDRKNTSTAAAGATATSAKASHSTLQKVHESNSRAASSFVDDIVGGAGAADATAAPAPAPQPATAAASAYADDVSTVLCVGDEQSTVTGGRTRSTSSGALSVDAQRRQLFCTNLNDIMTKRMVEEMSIEDILTQVNDTTQEQKSSSAALARPFTNLEIRTYLNELDRQQRIMVTWDTGTVYKI